MSNRPTVRSRLRACALALVLPASAAAIGGCSDAQAGTLLGAGIGALAGQAIGGDTEATLIGTGIGAGVGYAVGNESDKGRHGREMHGGYYHSGYRCNYDY